MLANPGVIHDRIKGVDFGDIQSYVGYPDVRSFSRKFGLIIGGVGKNSGSRSVHLFFLGSRHHDSAKLVKLLRSGGVHPSVFPVLLSVGRQVDPNELGLVKITSDFAQAWQSGQRPAISDFLNRVSEDLRCSLLQRLLPLDARLRQQTGEVVSVDDYRQLCESVGLEPETLGRLIQTEADEPATDLGPSVTRSFDPRSTVTYISQAGIGVETRGRYRLNRILGEGNFGRVYLGYDEELQRQVAIKVPTKEHFQKQGDAETYLTEARTVAGLDHPHIVPVYDMGRTDDGSVYVVSRYVAGTTLEGLIKEARPPHRESAELVATIATALHYAHQKRLIHRDIKPANILIDDATGTPFVADFGLAIREDDYLKEAGLAGTPAYMSPEQARGEGHRLDGRSDICSLGVVLYELLTGKRPFRGSSMAETLHLVISETARPPRERDQTISPELDRICLKTLSKRASDRYPTAAALAEDLREWLKPKATAISPRQVQKITPRGLRSFTSEDADFFLDLLPGPRNRDGLPESIAFWKQRIEQRDPEQTFSVGLLYGPSGCGKSSLVKAGLIPHLSAAVIAIYIEATPEETERRLLRGLKKRLPELPDDLELVEFLERIRRSEGPKVVLIIDQFEQWLHSHPVESAQTLPSGLRQCDGGRLQAILMIRDDFYLAAARLMNEIDVPITTDQNFKLVDLFDTEHAQSVLLRFGQAYGKLPYGVQALSTQQSDFMLQVVDGLSEGGKVVSVRLALLAEMLKGRDWVPATLETIGGLDGIGVSFLEETFASNRSDARHRQHQEGVRGVLRELLPETGTDIKGAMCGEETLLEASGYANRKSAFQELLRILDGELRLVTPTDPDSSSNAPDRTAPHSSRPPATRHYQLTHDYLVPSLREWLTRKQRETRRGRAELKLAERAAIWTAKPENRSLPSLWEYAQIRMLTTKSQWSDKQKAVMSRATRLHALRSTLATLAMIALLAVGLTIRSNVARQQEATRLDGLVGRLESAEPGQIPIIVAELESNPELAAKTISPLLQQEAITSDEKRSQLHARLASVGRDPTLVEPLLEELLSGKVTYVAPIRELLRPYAAQQRDKLEALFRDSTADIDRRFRAALALADYVPASEAGFWTDPDIQLVSRQLVSSNAEFQPLLRDILQPIKYKLLDALAAIFGDEAATSVERVGAANALADYSIDDIPRLLQLLLVANVEQYRILFPLVDGQAGSDSLQPLRDIVGQRPGKDWDEAQRVALGRQRAGAAITLLKLGDRQAPLEALKASTDMEAISQFAARCKDRAVSAADLLVLWDEVDRIRLAATGEERQVADRMLYGLLVTLGSYSPESLPADQRAGRMEQLVVLYSSDPSSGVHGASGWLLRQWGQGKAVERIDCKPIPYTPEREWFVMEFQPPWNEEVDLEAIRKPFYITFVVFPAGQYQIGSPTSEKGRSFVENQVLVTLTRPVAIADKEICWGQFSPHDRDSHRQSHAGQFNRTLTMADPSFGVNWYEAVGYCRWLGQVMGMTESEQCYPDADDLEKDADGNPRSWPLRLDRGGFRLPTEAEWEIACRGEMLTSYSFGSDREMLSRYGWYQDNSGGWSHPVGQLPPDSRGMFDTHGNLLEWTHDFTGSRDNVMIDPTGPETGMGRVTRGGSWVNLAAHCRVAYRSLDTPTNRTASIGFRIALSPSSKVPAELDQASRAEADR